METFLISIHLWYNKQPTSVMKKLNLLLAWICLPFLMQAQDFNQTVKGRVLDAQSKSPLIGATIVVIGSSPLIGSTTDIDGIYKLENVPTGRHTIKINYLGYEEKVVPNVVVTSSKQVVINIELTENVMMTDEVVITAAPDKFETMNKLTSVSARTFDIEETSRYAGSRNDPARMASNFAGVSGANDSRNDIIIRGNSPNGLLWRMDGINIPNPNHFGAMSATGGPVSLLNYNLLSNSDFMTAAFPAEYGNALAGVFDLQMRNGNNEEREYLGQIGFNGFEFGAEGPFKKGKKASYVANYRYSTLGAFQAIGLDFGTGSATPKYQDLSFKVDLPTEKAGRFSVFGVGGNSSIDLLGSDLDTTSTDLYGNENEDVYVSYQNAFGGISHTYYFNKNTYYKATFAASRTWEKFRRDSLSTEDRTPIPHERSEFTNKKFSTHVLLNRKFNARNNVTAGVILDFLDYNLQNYRIVPGDFETILDSKGKTSMTQAYASWQHRFNDKLTLNTGINYQYLNLNGSQSLEPRLGINYKANSSTTFGAGYGQHSQMQPLETYFYEDYNSQGQVVQNNKNLDFVKSQHYVLSMDKVLGSNKRLKIEAYYQNIDNAAVDRQSSSFSMLNEGADFAISYKTDLVNQGVGTNYGVELTLEKFFSKGYYYLLTTSLFDSKYKGSDGVERNTTFNGGYVGNLLAGKEWKLGNKNKTLNIDWKLTVAGGRYYTPIDFEASEAAGKEILKEHLAYSEQLSDYFRTDIKISYRVNKKKVTHEFSLDIQNLTNAQNEFLRSYNPRTNAVDTEYQIGFFPIPQYRIIF